uniref:SFR19-like C-terminal domain-containing protein n=1 Tax=Periophthalmus magnuspinnatus TaxID=409849 RepID=A0A3B4A722_9GOBI
MDLSVASGFKPKPAFLPGEVAELPDRSPPAKPQAGGPLSPGPGQPSPSAAASVDSTFPSDHVSELDGTAISSTSPPSSPLPKDSKQPREMYDPFSPTDAEKEERAGYEEEVAEKYDPFEPTGSPASDHDMSNEYLKNQVEEQVQNNEPTKMEESMEEPPDSTDTLVDSPKHSPGLLSLRRTVDCSTIKEEHTDSEHSEIEEGEIVGLADREAGLKRPIMESLSVNSPSATFFGTKPERILRVLDGDGFVSVRADPDWPVNREPEEELVVGVEDLRRKLVSRRKERYITFPGSSITLTTETTPPSGHLHSPPPTPPPAPLDEEDDAAKDDLKSAKETKSKNQSRDRNSERSRDRHRERSRERTRGDRERSRERGDNERSRERGEKERSRDRDRYWDRHRDRDRDHRDRRSQRTDEGDSRGGRKRVHDSRSRERDSSKRSRRNSEKNDGDRERNRDRDRERDRERRRDGRPVVPPSIQDLNGSDLFAIKRTITVTTTTTTTTVPGSPRLAPDSPNRSPLDMDKSHRKKKRKGRSSPGDRVRPSHSLSPQQSSRTKSKTLTGSAESDITAVSSGLPVVKRTRKVKDKTRDKGSRKELGRSGKDNESRSPFLKPCSEPLSLGGRASSPSSSLVTKEKGGAGGSKAEEGTQGAASAWVGASTEPPATSGEVCKAASPHPGPAGSVPCSSSSSSSSTSVLPPSSSPPPSPPPSAAPMRDMRESSPDSQTVDSSCKTPEPSFLVEECPSQTSPTTPRSSSPSIMPTSLGTGLSLTPTDPPKPCSPPPCPSSSAVCGLSSLSLDPSSSSVSSSSTNKPPPPPPPPTAPALPWSLQTGVDCTAGGVLALTALLFKMEEANIASRAKAQEFIQATSQVSQPTPTASSQVPPSLPPPSRVSPGQFILHNSSHLHPCAQTPPPVGLSGLSSSIGDSGWDNDNKDPDKYLKKLHTQERAVEEVKLAIKPYYQRKDINKDEYKDILRKAVHKICHSRTGEINPVKVSNLVKLYVQRYKYFRKHGRKMDGDDREDREPGGLTQPGVACPPLRG